MGPIEIILIFVLPTVLILVGAGVMIVRRQDADATTRWIVGVLLWTLAALLVIYVITAILSRMI